MRSTVPQGRRTSGPRWVFSSAQRIFVIILLVEIVHKLSVLQHLIEVQDHNGAGDAWAPVSESLVNFKNNTNSVWVQNSSLDGGDISGASVANDSSTIAPICRIPPSQGPEGAMGFQALTKIRSFTAEKLSKSVTEKRLRLLCIVVTNDQHDVTTLPAILDTYAPRCDGFLGVTNRTRSSLPSTVSLPGETEWERLKQVWKYVRKEYLEASPSFEAFHFGVESTFVIPDNLRSLLASFPDFSSNQPMYVGGAVVAVRKAPEVKHCGGKAGYTLNRAALADLTDRLHECHLDPENPGLPVDQRLAHCLQQVGQIQCTKTVDKQSALRYVEFGLEYHAKFFSKSKKYVKRTPIKVKPLAEYHGIYIRDGLDGIAPDAVAFSVQDYWGNLVTGAPGFSLADAHRRTRAILMGTCKSVWDDPPIQALDQEGRPGYIHDATYLKRNPPVLAMFPNGDDYGVCERPFGSGREGPKGYQGLQKIELHETTATNTPSVKILCMIYTHSKQHSRLRAIAETYGPRCDGFLGASNKTDPSIGAVNLLHEGVEEYENMWLKVRSMWKYAYQHYLNEYDWFHIGGDDHYLIPENLRYMVQVGGPKGRWKESEPLFLGGNMIDFPHTEHRYCGGGSGYTLNRAALKVLIEELFETYHCRPHFRASDEDRQISNCFRSVGILCTDTNDEHLESRYHQASANFHANWTRALPAVWHPIPLETHHGIASQEGLGQISTSSVSFHLKGRALGSHDRGMRRYHAILHNLCSNKTMAT